MCLKYLNEHLNEEKLNELLISGPNYYNAMPGRYFGRVSQIEFYIDYSKMIPVCIVHIERKDDFNENMNHQLVIYLEPCNEYSQKILKSLNITWGCSLVQQFEDLINRKLIFDVVRLANNQSFIVDAWLDTTDPTLDGKVVVHLGKLDDPVVIDEKECDLLDPNSIVNHLVKTELKDYVLDWNEDDSSYYSQVAEQLF